MSCKFLFRFNRDTEFIIFRYNGWPAIRTAILVCEKDCISGQLDYQFKQSASSTTQGPSLKMKWGDGTYIQDRGDYCASEGGTCTCGGWISYGRDDNWVTSPTKASITRYLRARIALPFCCFNKKFDLIVALMVQVQQGCFWRCNKRGTVLLQEGKAKIRIWTRVRSERSPLHKARGLHHPSRGKIGHNCRWETNHRIRNVGL